MQPITTGLPWVPSDYYRSELGTIRLLPAYPGYHSIATGLPWVPSDCYRHALGTIRLLPPYPGYHPIATGLPWVPFDYYRPTLGTIRLLPACPRLLVLIDIPSQENNSGPFQGHAGATCMNGAGAEPSPGVWCRDPQVGREPDTPREAAASGRDGPAGGVRRIIQDHFRAMREPPALTERAPSQVWASGVETRRSGENPILRGRPEHQAGTGRLEGCGRTGAGVINDIYNSYEHH
uniref:Uncharacterized protein n=1 Tax=Branchiostoma floridae TaxID=7739 RepID=C3ZNB6_BRAFL|eukprot:XP_002589933.1 hypothetical protein BRAFLDRAFT_96034 [Branchiostoma floridae]